MTGRSCLFTGITMAWYALYTRSRHEKKVDALLTEKNVETYLPLYTQVRQWKDRKKKIEMPLFSSYLFVNFDYKYRFDILQTDGIIKIVHFNGNPAVIPDWQIGSLKKMLDEPKSLQLEQYFNSGELVEVIAGPMRGMRGMVMMRKNSHRLVLSIDGIMQSVSVEIDQGNLKKINNH